MGTIAGRSTLPETRKGAASTSGSPIGGGLLGHAQLLVPHKMISRQSETINNRNKPLNSEIGWPAGRKPESNKQSYSHAFISTGPLTTPSEDTASLKIQLL